MGRLTRVVSLAGVGLAGILLGSCGGSDSARTTATSLTATRPGRTATVPLVPTRTTGTLTAPTRTSEVTEPAPTVTEPAETVTEPVTTRESETVTTVETETTSVTILPPATTTGPTPADTTTEAADSDEETPWGWLALGAALLAALLIGLLIWSRRRSNAASWSARLDDLSGRSLSATDEVLVRGSLVTGRIQALAAEARSLEPGAPDAPSRAAAGKLRGSLDDLADALEADRTLRLASPPPSAEQLTYSNALIRQHVQQLQGTLRPAGA